MNNIRSDISNRPATPLKRNTLRTNDHSHGKTFLCIPAASALKASLTLECAFVLPLFLFSMLSLVFFINLTGDMTEMNLSLSNKARTAAMYSGTVSDNDTWIDLSRPCEYRSPFGIIPLPEIKVPARARVHVWNGKKGGHLGEGSYGSQDGTAVYVTEYESVYHTDPECTHLDLSVSAVPYSEVGSMRNIYGEKYQKCVGFPAGYTGTVYISRSGNRYYPASDYGGITRHVKTVRLSDVSGLHPCSRCGSVHHS